SSLTSEQFKRVLVLYIQFNYIIRLSCIIQSEFYFLKYIYIYIYIFKGTNYSLLFLEYTLY
ncbi:MAG: hypothetical protein N7Q72_06595, partial [Spiroplasma sp. Tabriz.8]|nr:hypothetical protein [Spiroplasma sp. Tabriz.8]